MTDTPIHHWTFDNISGSYVIDEISGGENLYFSSRSVGTGWDGNAMLGGSSDGILKLSSNTTFKAIFLRFKLIHSGATYVTNICSNSSTDHLIAVYNNLIYFYNNQSFLF